MFCEKDVVKNFAELTVKHLCQNPSFNNVEASGNFIKKEALAQVFSYEFCEIFNNTTDGCFSDMFSFGLSSVIFRISVADFEHVFVCWERYRITIVVL